MMEIAFVMMEIGFSNLKPTRIANDDYWIIRQNAVTQTLRAISNIFYLMEDYFLSATGF